MDDDERQLFQVLLLHAVKGLGALTMSDSSDEESGGRASARSSRRSSSRGRSPERSEERAGARRLEDKPEWKCICAIDFGTACSGYAFFVKDDREQKVNVNTQFKNSKGTKTSTSILLKKNGDFVAFGCEAQEKFYNMEPEEAENFLFFEKFKMLLKRDWEDKSLSRDITLKAHNGQRFPALEVFSHALRFMKDSFFKRIHRSGTVRLDADDVLWVLTVPAIWQDSAKQFMREAALKAGLFRKEEPSRLLIALEPEAAGLYCKDLPVGNYMHTVRDLGSMDPGDAYVIMDNGGGTVDVAVHQLNADGSVRELYEPTGGDWGGENPNKAFMKLLGEVYGEDTMDKLRERNAPQLYEMITSFEKAKRNWNHEESGGIKVALSHEFSEIVREMYSERKGKNLRTKDALPAATEEYAKKKGLGIKYLSGNFYLTTDMMQKLMDESVEPMTKHMVELLAKPELDRVMRVFLVGGLSECAYLQEKIKAALPSRLQILVPLDPETAVLKGAVAFGRSQNLVTHRKAKWTYGVLCRMTYNPKIHPSSKKMLDKDSGRYYVRDCFFPFVRKGDNIRVGKWKSDSFGYVGVSRMPAERQRSIEIAILASQDRDVRFSNERGVKKLGTVAFYIPRGVDGRQGCEIDFNFGQTEFKVVGKDKESKKHGVTVFNFLSD